MKQDAIRFVQALYPSAGPHGFVAVCSSVPGQKTGGMLSKHFRTDDAEGIAAYAESEDAAQRNVYLSLCAHASDLGSAKRGSRAQKILAPGAWLDIDVAGPNHAAQNLPRTIPEVVEILQAFDFEPSMVVRTGGGVHAYWLFDAPISLEKDRLEVQKFLRAWQERAAEAAKVKSWHVDNTSDMARVLRIPGTHNWKPAAIAAGTPAPMVDYLIADGQRYAYPILRGFMRAKSAEASAELASLFGQTSAPGIASHDGETPEAAEPNSLTPPAEALAWDDEKTKAEILDKIKRNRKADRKATLEAFRDGKPWAVKGERDSKAQQLASWLAWYTGGMGSIAAVCALAEPSLRAMEEESPEDFISEDQFEEKVARAMVDARHACDENRKIEERFMDRSFAQARGQFEKVAQRALSAVPAAPAAPAATDSVSAPQAAIASEPEGCAPSIGEAAPGGAFPEPSTVTITTAEGSVTTPADAFFEAAGARASTALALVPQIVKHEGDEEEDGTPARYYSLSELEAAAEDQSALSGLRVTVVDLKKLFIIQKGETFYVLQRSADGIWRYHNGIQRGELQVSIPRDLRCIPKQIPYQLADGEVRTARTPETMVFFDWEGYKADGTTRKKTLQEVLDELCTVARGGVIYDFTIERSFYSPIDQTLHVAAGVVRKDIEPEFNADVDAWLRTFGDTQADTDKFLDWTATLTKLDSPTSGLYLSGPKSAGKTMYALGCASLWNAGYFLEMSALFSSFNAGLIGCPVVVADEMLPNDTNGKPVQTHRLRKIIGDSNHELRIKFQSNAVIKGAIRAIFLANDENMLSTGDENLGAEALAAVAGRFLHIRANEKGAEFLRNLGGRHGDAETGKAGTKDWIDGSIIAKHFLWLRDNRPVKMGDRFVVEGEASKVHFRLASNGSVPSLVVDWLVYCLEKPGDDLLREYGVLLGEGRFLVNAPRMLKYWDKYIKSDRATPTLSRINKALSNLAIRPEHGDLHREEIDGKRIAYHVINVDQILQNAEESGIGDPAVLRKTINGPSRNKFDKSAIAAAFGNDPTKKG